LAESLGNVVITPQDSQQTGLGSSTKTKPKPQNKPTKKWSRKKGDRKGKKLEQQLVSELGKRQLVEVTISEGDPMILCGVEQKRKVTVDKNSLQLPDGVLANQHLLPQ